MPDHKTFTTWQQGALWHRPVVMAGEFALLLMGRTTEGRPEGRPIDLSIQPARGHSFRVFPTCCLSEAPRVEARDALLYSTSACR